MLDLTDMRARGALLTVPLAGGLNLPPIRFVMHEPILPQALRVQVAHSPFDCNATQNTCSAKTHAKKLQSHKLESHGNMVSHYL